jgi:acyl-CoA thioester hydrolase
MSKMSDCRDAEHVDVTIRVRYAETDQMGIAYYANYLTWFEVGRTEFCRQRGFSYAQLETETDTFIPVAEVSCRYRRPLHYDDEFVLRTRVEKFRRKVVIFSYEVLSRDGETRFAEGLTRHVFTDGEGTPKPLPEEYWKFLT